MPIIQTEPFLPLTHAGPTTGDRPEFRVSVLSQPGHARTFRPLAPAPATPTPPRESAGEPRVAVQREGDRVSGIRIECACGQVIDLACVYQDPPGTSQSLA